MIDHAVVQAEHGQVELRDEDVHVIARIADQGRALAIARNVRLLARIVHAEEQHGRVVAPVEKRAANRTVAVDALQVRAWRAEVLHALTGRSVGERAAVGRDVVGDQLAEQGPSGSDVDGVVQASPPSQMLPGPAERQQPLLVALDGGQIREEPLVPARRAIEWRVGGARRREAAARAGLDRRVWRLGGHDLRGAFSHPIESSRPLSIPGSSALLLGGIVTALLVALAVWESPAPVRNRVPA